jgi:hypothetical protein
MGIDVDRVDVRSSRGQQSGGKHTNESAANDRDAIAELDAREANRMQRDRGDRAERSVPWLNSSGDPSAEVTRDRDDLGVVGMPAAGTRDQVTDFEAGGSCPYLNHASCGAVTNRCLLGQLPLHRAQRLRDPLATSSVDHLSHEVGARARLPHE